MVGVFFPDGSLATATRACEFATSITGTAAVRIILGTLNTVTMYFT
jgi:hypothetical protein